MSKLLLVRHGQASFGSSNYDQLSPTGYQQGEWLGEYLRSANIKPTHMIVGDLQRHRQTAESIMKGLGQDLSLDIHAGWNEFDFHTVITQYLSEHPEQTPETRTVKAFLGVLRNALLAWSKNKIGGQLPETWQAFEARVRDALSAAQIHEADTKHTVLVVSSGGAIAMALKHLLRYDNEALVNMNLQSRNTGITECYYNQANCYVTSFNAVPHLETEERRSQITSA